LLAVDGYVTENWIVPVKAVGVLPSPVSSSKLEQPLAVT
jgi:hypothetical protein